MMQARRGPMERILVFQTWGIGDMIMATPMLTGLRKSRPGVKVTAVAGSQATAGFLKGGLVDDVRVVAPGKLKFPELAKVFLGFRRERFDAAIVCTRLSWKIAAMLRLFSRVGAVAGDGPGYSRLWYTHWRPIRPDSHRVTSNVDIAKTLFPDLAAGPVYSFLGECPRLRAQEIWKETGWEGRKVLGVHPGSGAEDKEKRIPPGILKNVIRSFLGEFPESRVMLFLGPLEREMAPLFDGMDERVRPVAGAPLDAVAAVIAKLGAFLAGDTGLGHVAAAQGVPTVTVAGPTRVSATRPWGGQGRVVQTRERLPCMPCYGTPLYGNCPFGVKCMKQVTDRQILAELAPYFRA